MRTDFRIASIGSYNHNNIRFEYFIIIIICSLVALCTIMLLHLLYSVCYNIMYVYTIIYVNCFRSITLIDDLKRLRCVLFNRQICLYSFHQITNHYKLGFIRCYILPTRENDFAQTTALYINRHTELWYIYIYIYIGIF